MIYQLKISLKRCKPPIWRRIQVHQGITFHQLHQLIQLVMDWEDAHLHGFVCKVLQAKHQQAEERMKENFWGPTGFSLFPAFQNDLEAHIGDPGQMDDFFTPTIFFEEKKEILADWLTVEKAKCTYTYDFGDDWQHEILLEKILPIQPDMKYPFCLKAKQEPPLEDSGGFWDAEEGDGRTDAEIVADINAALHKLADRF
jgi:hypothetical protein